MTDRLSLLGDGAISLLAGSVADYDAVSRVGPSSGRIFWARNALGAYDFNNARAQNYLFRCVSIIEAYTDAVLEAMFESVLVGSPAAASLLLEQHLQSATQSWGNRKRSFREHHELSLGAFGQWSKVMALVDVRNAVAHGLGSMTRIQRLNPQGTIERLKLIGVRIEAAELLVDRTNVVIAADVASTYVRWLDAKLDL